MSRLNPLAIACYIIGARFLLSLFKLGGVVASTKYRVANSHPHQFWTPLISISVNQLISDVLLENPKISDEKWYHKYVPLSFKICLNRELALHFFFLHHALRVF